MIDGVGVHVMESFKQLFDEMTHKPLMHSSSVHQIFQYWPSVNTITQTKGIDHRKKMFTSLTRKASE